MHAGQLRSHGDHEQCAVVVRKFHQSPLLRRALDAFALRSARGALGNALASASIACRCSSVSSAGTCNSTVTRNAPPPMPRFGTRNVLPDGVPAGTLIVTLSPSIVG